MHGGVLNGALAAGPPYGARVGLKLYGLSGRSEVSPSCHREPARFGCGFDLPLEGVRQRRQNGRRASARASAFDTPISQSRCGFSRASLLIAQELKKPRRRGRGKGLGGMTAGGPSCLLCPAAVVGRGANSHQSNMGRLQWAALKRYGRPSAAAHEPRAVRSAALVMHDGDHVSAGREAHVAGQRRIATASVSSSL
jgi:hypothetical protein